MFKSISFRSRIILIFSFITILLVAVLARFSYLTVREIYLRQLERQVTLEMRMAAGRIHRQHLDYLISGVSGSLVGRYYQASLAEIKSTLGVQDVFLFDNELNVLASADSAAVGSRDPSLLLSKTEIEGTTAGESSVSLPFKGVDGEWYLWGFFRLDQRFCLGIRENAAELVNVERLSWIVWTIGLLGLGLTMVGSFLLAKTLARPIEKLVRFSKAMERGDWNEPAPKVIHGELMSLVHAMDQMRKGLVSKQAEKEQMLAQIAHEIRNPLGGIELMAGLIAEDLRESKRNPEYASRIRDEVSSLKSLITNYLTFGKPADANPQWVEVQEIAVQVKEMVRDRITEKGISMDCDVGSLKLWFDTQQLKQVLLNLVSNAVEVLGSGGRVWIQSGLNGSTVSLDVRDNGPGISNDQLSSVFEPFFTTGRNGSGLGLAISRKLCRDNGSTLTVKNNPDGGCTFTIAQSYQGVR